MKILVADDDVGVRSLLRASLIRGGHEVQLAGDGQVAWEAWQRENFPLVITDWSMPRVEGPELIRRIRAAGSSNYTYIILLTVKQRENDVVAGLESGTDDYLTKPFNPRELLARVAIGERILTLQAQLQELAIRDPLTGLFNRRAFDTRLEGEMQRAERYGRPLSLIMIDLDHFKFYNDANGHPQGDILLQEASQVIQAGVRSTDVVARYGGEEFVVILPETPVAAALIVAKDIQETVAAHPFPRCERQPGGQLTISLGVASYPEDTGNAQQLLQRVDEVLYQAKRNGRNQVVRAVSDQLVRFLFHPVLLKDERR